MLLFLITIEIWYTTRTNMYQYVYPFYADHLAIDESTLHDMSIGLHTEGDQWAFTI